ncbi:hypothetical protein C1T31_03220 [Hanstruepera neustonica]|uniref:DUF1697 domain-containing protein n=1 Tax=Hanstruepera neustonica TaxID=1445657 RepID=A0A2K1E4G7_9FLAO|nr:DUF1697 domain-containing protein [Hanstruepera neustonica]PNQ75160.1 hypothetical protein C1T31_03220 [Hanstruepera neustonica]
MITYIVLLKGINVGGHKKVPMAELRQLLSNSGFTNVRTYIQSGNIILQSNEKNQQQVEVTISKAILKHFGFEVSVLAKTRTELKRIFDQSPFPEEKKKASYFMMLHDMPDSEKVREASQKVYEGEDYQIIEDCIYYFHDKGLSKAKFNVNFFERKFQTFATARNYNTMIKLLSLSED